MQPLGPDASHQNVQPLSMRKGMLNYDDVDDYDYDDVCSATHTHTLHMHKKLMKTISNCFPASQTVQTIPLLPHTLKTC